MDVVLVSPLKPENIGSIARVMMNFGYQRLILVSPRVNPSDKNSLIVARKARTILENCIILDDVEMLRKRYSYIIGTTARIGGEKGLKRLVLNINQFLDTMTTTLASQWNESAIIFGPEDRGLSNQEAEICDVLVTIPTHSDYPVLNISHATAIFLYLLNQYEKNNFSKNSKFFPIKEKHRPATKQEKNLLVEKFQRVVIKSKFREHKQPVAVNAFKNILSRGYVSGREVLVLMGLFNWLERLLELKDRPSSDDH